MVAFTVACFLCILLSTSWKRVATRQHERATSSLQAPLCRSPGKTLNIGVHESIDEGKEKIRKIALDREFLKCFIISWF